MTVTAPRRAVSKVELVRDDSFERFNPAATALDCAVVRPGTIRVGDAVELRPAL